MEASLASAAPLSTLLSTRPHARVGRQSQPQEERGAQEPGHVLGVVAQEDLEPEEGPIGALQSVWHSVYKRVGHSAANRSP